MFRGGEQLVKPCEHLEPIYQMLLSQGFTEDWRTTFPDGITVVNMVERIDAPLTFAGVKLPDSVSLHANKGKHVNEQFLFCAVHRSILSWPI